MKNYVMNDGKNFFDQPIKDNNKHIITYENIGKITSSQGDTIQWVVFSAISILKIIKDLRKQQPLDADLKAIQKINFKANLDTPGRTRIYLILEEAKETVLQFSQGTLKVL